MIEYFNLAAILYYRISVQNIKTSVKMYLHKNWNDINNLIPNDKSIIAFLKDFCDSHFTEFSSLSNKEEPFTDDELLLSFILIRALDRYCSSEKVLNVAKINKSPLNNKYLNYVEFYAAYGGVRRDNKASDNYSSLFENLVVFIKIGPLSKKSKLFNVYLDGDQSKLRIGLVSYPLCKNPPYKIEDKKVAGIIKDEINDTDSLFIEKCVKAVESPANCDIIICPEMYGSKQMDKKLRQLCSEVGCKLIVCPSYYDTGPDGINRSQATVYAVTNGITNKYVYYKLSGAKFFDGSYEDICEPDVYNILLFHAKNIGRIGVFLCSDYFSSDVRTIIEELNIDLVLLECYTNKTSDFLGRMREGVSKKHFVLLANACQAMCKNTEKVIAQYTNYNYKHDSMKENNELKDVYCNKVDCEQEKCVHIFEFEVEKLFTKKGEDKRAYLRKIKD